MPALLDGRLPYSLGLAAFVAELAEDDLPCGIGGKVGDGESIWCVKGDAMCRASVSGSILDPAS